jgi:hypothetical protein
LTGENRSTRGKTCPSATLSTTNPTWTDPGSNLVLRVERPATNRLSHDTATSPLMDPVLSQAKHCTSSQYIALRHISILPFYLHFRLSSCHFPSNFSTKICCYLHQWYSTLGTRTPGGTRRHLRGYVKLKINKYIIS